MIRVLLVDDHAIVRGGLRALLETTADLVVVGEAADGEEAVSLADGLRPDVVLMDLSMPGVDGVAATAAVLQRSPDSHVLVLTSFGEQKWIVEALAAGAEGYLLKHSEPEVILAGIREVMVGGSPLDPKAARALITSRRDPGSTERPASGTPGRGNADDSRGTARGAVSPLTERERQVLEMVSNGLPNKAIARRLGITERTVKAHLTSIFQRLGVNDRTQAALWAQRQRLS